MLTLWFNRTYATAAHLFPMLRDNPDGVQVRIIATHPDEASPVLGAADLGLSEPAGNLPGDTYIEWALAFCATHRVDVFVPRLHLLAVAEARSDFESAGIAVLAAPPAAIRLLDDKAAAYVDASTAGLRVPPYLVVRTADELQAAHAALMPEGDLCIKPVRGTGGVGYRRIHERAPSLNDIVAPLQPEVRLADLVAAVRSATTSLDLMVMPYLPGPEVSVDCLADSDGRVLVSIPRTKDGRLRSLVEDPQAEALAKAIVARHRLRSLSNTQVRYWKRPGVDDEPRPYLLETNPRASAGLFQTALSGVNMVWSAVREARGLPSATPPAQLGHHYTTVSSLAPRWPSTTETQDPG